MSNWSAINSVLSPEYHPRCNHPCPSASNYCSIDITLESEPCCPVSFPPPSLLQLQELQDVVAASAQDDEDDNAGTAAGGPSSSAGGSARGTKRRRLFAEHKAHGDMMAGIKEGKYHQVSTETRWYGYWEKS